MHTKRRQMTGSSWGAGMRSSGQGLVILLGLLGCWQTCQAADFACPAGDVACLIEAINTANGNGQTNTIRLEAGTYTLTKVHNGTGGDTNGLTVIMSPLTIMGAGAETTIIERDTSAPEFRLLKVAETGTLTLKGLTLRGGESIGDGGGIYNSGTLTLTHCTLVHNMTSLVNLGGTYGGGIYNGGTLTLTHCTLAYNMAGGGGGIYNGGTLTLTHCTLASNTARKNGGGGIANDGTLTLTHCTLASNAAGGYGGGGGIDNSGTLTLINCTLAHNTGIDGGGILNVGGTLTLTNCTLAHNLAYNTAGGYGGGINNVDGSVTLQNTILALNGQADECFGGVTSLGTNLIGDAPGCAITRPQGISDPTGDPGLDTFTDDGTPGHGHFPLLPTSRAIDAGHDAACPPTDQVGQPRAGRCDIGAMEFQPLDTTPPVITITATPETLWPPNGKMVSVTIVGTITDAGSGVDPRTATYAVTDAYGSVQPSGPITFGANGSYVFTISLRASRNGNNKDGRQYLITVSVQDNAGNTGAAATGVTVPHAQRQNKGRHPRLRGLSAMAGSAGSARRSLSQ